MSTRESVADSEGIGKTAPHARYEMVVGLEVHVQLKTLAKLFSSAPHAFGAPPNSQTTEVDLGLPGVLPVLNAHAVELAVRAALALGCKLQPVSTFARKHYFYPDLPKGYQISQYDEPFAKGGAVPLANGGGEPRSIDLTRIHLEEDAAKNIHDDAVTGGGVTHVDLNRAGARPRATAARPTARGVPPLPGHPRLHRAPRKPGHPGLTYRPWRRTRSRCRRVGRQ